MLRSCLSYVSTLYKITTDLYQLVIDGVGFSPPTFAQDEPFYLHHEHHIIGGTWREHALKVSEVTRSTKKYHQTVYTVGEVFVHNQIILIFIPKNYFNTLQFLVVLHLPLWFSFEAISVPSLPAWIPPSSAQNTTYIPWNLL